MSNEPTIPYDPNYNNNGPIQSQIQPQPTPQNPAVRQSLIINQPRPSGLIQPQPTALLYPVQAQQPQFQISVQINSNDIDTNKNNMNHNSSNYVPPSGAVPLDSNTNSKSKPISPKPNNDDDWGVICCKNINLVVFFIGNILGFLIFIIGCLVTETNSLNVTIAGAVILLIIAMWCVYRRDPRCLVLDCNAPTTSSLFMSSGACTWFYLLWCMIAGILGIVYVHDFHDDIHWFYAALIFYTLAFLQGYTGLYRCCDREAYDDH